MSKNGIQPNPGSKTNGGKSQLAGILIVLSAAALFSTLGVLTNLAFESGISPVAFAAWRETFGAITMMILLLFGVGRPARAQRIPFSQIPKSELRNLCIGALAFMTYSLAIFYAFVHLTVALAYLLFYINPALVTLISTVTGREVLTKPKLIALLLALGGSTMAIVGQMFGTEVRFDWIGIALALLAAVGMSVYILVGRSGYSSVPASYATTIFLVAGAIAFAIIGFSFGDKDSLLLPFQDGSHWPLLMFAGVIAAAVPTMMLLTGIRMIGATRSSMLQIFEPVVGSVLAAIFLAQQLYFVQIVGGALILIAAYILQRSPEPEVEAAIAEPAGVSVSDLGSSVKQ
ncbi:DMT family transporter [Brevibacillus nitrificans]|uniref:DMT family transporter n=1 Tax=Brevibacillus nitrificans TaxID=651560 RepID=A0A3M8DCI4_9BACL|nr:DMT family transporter [Brevibacillus nitrificans]RNB85321.1 DMT family transporter [Brevibacillus nitrificans]